MIERASLPIVDVAPLRRADADIGAVAAAIGRACRTNGFFYVVGHGVEPALTARLERLARAFFARPLAEKMRIRMERGGCAWRGYFPLGAELTSGRPDRKEGLYFGAELPPDDPRVRAGVPLHGPNLFPPLAGFRETVLATLEAMTALGRSLVEAVGASLGLPRSFFADRYTAEPLVLFRIFHYPPVGPGESAWSVGEHTDYGLLTILYQDECGGLEIRTPEGWIAAPPVPGSFVCNLGDMLERMTGGLYRSTPHRVRNTSGRSRIAMPFFFDPSFDARIEPLPTGGRALADGGPRWDGESPLAFDGTYGEYLLRKVSRVFPHLRRRVL